MIVYWWLAQLKEDTLIPVGHLDTDWATDHDDCKLILAYIFTLAGGPIVWVSKKQKSIATSLCEAELYVLSLAAMQALYV